MSTAPFEVLVALADSGAASTAAAALRRRGHDVALVSDTSAALEHESVDAIVCDLDMLGALRRSGCAARAIVVDLPETADAWRSALRLGASDALSRPWRLAELVEAVEAGPRAALPATPDDTRLDLQLEAEAGSLERGLRELCGWLARLGISPAARARTLSATAELLENAARHAYGSGLDGLVQLSAACDGGEVRVEVRDAGAGFEPQFPAQGAANTGLERVAALTEGLRVTSRPGQGTRVVLRIHTQRADFGELGVVDLSEHDWLSPALARRVLASLKEPEEGPFYNLSPALAVTIGRLLAGSTERQRVERSLWS